MTYCELKPYEEPEVHHVNVHLSANRIVEGFYTLTDGILTMTFADGEPVLLDEAIVQRTLQPGDKPHQVAGYLTKQIRRSMIGEQVEGFNDPINYPRAGIA
jgi:hypothetical protein